MKNYYALFSFVVVLILILVGSNPIKAGIIRNDTFKSTPTVVITSSQKPSTVGTTSDLALESHTIVANYSGATGFTASSNTFNQLVNAVPSITGFAAVGTPTGPATVCTGQTTTFTATIGNVTDSYDFTLTNGNIGAPGGTTTGTTSNTAFSQSWTAGGYGLQSFTLTVSANGSLTSATTSLTVGSVISNTAINYWGGCISTDWQTADNWSKGHIPTASEDVALLATTPNQPLLNGAGVAYSVDVPANTTLTIGSSGTLTINGSRNTTGGLTAFYNAGMVLNSGMLILGNTANVGTFGLINAAIFRNEAGALIRIDRSATYGLFNSQTGTFSNLATITIGAIASVGQYGIHNFSSFINATGGQITINNTTNVGLYNNTSGIMSNSATITIGTLTSVGQSGIGNLGTINNAANGIITIDRVTDSGLLNYPPGTFNNSATITIGASGTAGEYGLENMAGGTFRNAAGGQISIANSTSAGLFNSSSSKFSNSATITIGASGSVGQYGIQNVGSFTNTAGGQISIDRSSNTGFYLLSASGSVINSGTITIGALGSVGQYGINTTGPITNGSGGFIRIDNTSQAGLKQAGSGSSFSNSSTLIIGSSAAVGSYGIHSQEVFENKPGGYITIDRSSDVGLYTSNIFSNSALITIGALASVGQYGLQNIGSFTNSADGQINIDNSSSVGLAHLTPSQFLPFTNSGTITIGANATVGSIALGVSQVNAVFTNNAGGLITLARSTTVGLDNFLSTINNAGTIRAGNIAGVGQYALRNNIAVVNNLAGGTIYLDGATNTGLLNVNGVFTNSSTILVGSVSPVGPTGVSNGTLTFANSGCAALLKVVSDAVITNSGSGTFTNTGTIIENAGGNSNISSNAGLVLNQNSGTFSTGTGPNAPLSITGTSPTTCSPANGSFTLTGLQANTTYTLSYTRNGTPATVSPDPVSDANGQVILLGMSGGAYTFSLSGSCVAQALSFSATLNNAPLSLTVTAAPSLTITQGNTVTLTASAGAVPPGTSYAWTGGSTGAAFTASPASTTTFSVTGLNASGCSSVTSVTVTVNAPICYSVVYVTQNGAGLQNGSSWANAYPGTMLQTAINSATSCSGQVWVAAGLYKPTAYTGAGSRAVFFQMRNNAGIYGGFTGTETTLTGPAGRTLTMPSSTTLSGEIDNDNTNTNNSYHVVVGSSLNNTARLDGVVITGGNANGVSEDSGGGIFIISSSPTLANCVLQSNTAVFGAGMRNMGGSPALLNCMIRNNVATSGGGGVYLNSGVSMSLTSCTLTGNSSVVAGGGIYAYSSGIVLTNCILESNTATSGGGIVAQLNTTVQLINCGFLNNVGLSDGAGMYMSNTATAELTNCSFHGNKVPANGRALGVNASSLTATNSVFWNPGSGTEFYIINAGSIVVRYSLMAPSSLTQAGVTGGPGNLTTSVSPFASTTSTELAPCSPAIDAGNNSATGLTGITTDLAGNNRLFNNGRVDMGAYEFQSEGLPTSFSVLGSGTATCASSPTITLSGSETGVSYQLQRNSANLGNAVPGTGALLSFGTQPQSGTYTVVASRASSSCSLVLPTSATVVSSSVVISASLVASGAISCNSPSATLTASPSNLTYTFGNGVTQLGSTNLATVSSAGTYSVTLTNAGGCSAVAQVTVTGSTTTPSVSINPSSATLTCASPTVSLSAVGTGTVRWSTGATTPLISVSVANTYSVTLTGTNGCTNVASTTVISNTVAASVSVTPGSGILSCASPTVSLSAIGTGTVLWSTGATTPVISATVAGTYSVTLTNASGCRATASATVSGSVLNTVSLTTDGPVGCGRLTATVIIQGSGASSYTLLGPSGYSAVNGTGVFSVTAGGSYTGLASQSGCELSGVVVVGEGGIPPVASNFRASGVLGAGSCSVQLLGIGVGNAFVITGPGGYVFSNVYRSGGTRELVGFSVSRPGTYTLTVYSGSCLATYTVVVSGTACPAGQ